MTDKKETTRNSSRISSNDPRYPKKLKDIDERVKKGILPAWEMSLKNPEKIFTTRRTYISNNGHKYTGGWKNGYFHGKGTFEPQSGGKWVAEWKNGLKHGEATYSSSKGVISRIEAEFTNDVMNGHAIYIYKNGNKYDGQVCNGKRHGIGIMTCAKTDLGQNIIWSSWDDNSEYAGEWKSNKRDGIGKYSWPNGDIYEGEWHQSKKHGIGIKTYKNGKIEDGFWENDIFVGEIDKNTSIEVKLKNLKELYNKKLISKEVYESKQLDILKG